MSWVIDKVFNNADEFLLWLDQCFGDYIIKHINENHVHHTYAPNHASYSKNSTLQLHKNMRNFHMNTNKWDDIAQNITIGKNGDIVLGRDIRKIPISAKGYNGSTNWHPFAYEMIGNFDKGNDRFEGMQLESAIKISRYFHKTGKPIKFHRELLLNGKQPKSCPGTGIDKGEFMSLVQNAAYDIQKSTAPQPIPTPQVSVVYEAHVQHIGWQGKKRNGETAGTVGESRRLEALTVKLEDSTARLEMEGHIENIGWTSARTNGEVLGTIGENLRLEAFKITCNQHEIAYRAHVQNIGWTEWKKNGEVVGTIGESLRIEAIEIKLI